MITSNGIEESEIDCTAGDGIALSIVFGCPLFASKEVLDLNIKKEIKYLFVKENVSNKNCQNNKCKHIKNNEANIQYHHI